MESTVKNLSGVEKILNVVLSKEDLAGFLKGAESRILSGLEVDGFRKGKVPKDMLRKYVDENQIREAALEDALHVSFANTVKEQGWDVLSTEELKILENNADKLSFEIKVVLYPDIKAPDLTLIKISRKEPEVKEEEIANALEVIRSSRAKLSPKKEAASEGDKLEIDFEVTIGGKVLDGGVSKSHPFVLGKGNFIPGFEAQIMGMKADEEKKFSIEAPKDYYDKQLAGKTLDCTVKINSVQSVELPDLTDDFAKGLGNFEGLAALKSSVAGGILEEKKVKEKEKTRLEILEAALGRESFDVPVAMVERQLDSMVSDFDNHLHRQGLELGFYLAHVKKTREDLRKDWRSDAEKQVKMGLMLHAIAKDKNISAAQEEVDAETGKIVDMLTVQGQVDAGKIDLAKLREETARQIVNEKTLQLLEDTCSQ